MRLIRLFIPFVLALFPAVYASAQFTINFDDLTLPNYGPIPGNYGSGLDPHMSNIAYRTFVESTDVTVAPYLEFWNNDYGDLNKVAFSSENGRIAEIAFTPAPGYAVHLISFDMAGYPQVDLSNSTMRLVDSSNNILINFAALGPVAVQGDTNGAQHTTFTPNLTFNGTVRLQWGNNWNVGIDNVRFEAVAVPEASTFVLMGAGIAGWLAQGYYRRKVRAKKSISRS